MSVQHLGTMSMVKRSKPNKTHNFGQKIRLIYSLTKREVLGRYRGSVLGLVWSMVTPLMMLGIYTFVFGMVFQSRWVSGDGAASPGEFSVILFVGLILFQLLADTVTRAPSLMLSNASYVKKVVFPLEILVPVTLGTALFHALVSLIILLPFVYLVFGGIPITTVLLPVVVLPLIIMVLGLSWFLASIGVYLRDIGQFVGTAVTALLFLAPIFFPLTALPIWLQPWLKFNPLSLPVNQAREVLIFGNPPNFVDLGIYTIVAGIVCVLGLLWFQKTRKGFADVL